MPARFSITREDQLRSKTVTPGWYPCVIKSVEQKAAKTDGSTNTNVKFVVAGGPFDGVPVERVFSEKAPGFAISFIEAILGRKIKPEGEDFDFEMAAGKKLSVYIKTEMYQNRPINRAEDFQTLR